MIKSAKPAGFCAGADLQTILSCRTPEECQAFVTHGLRVLEHLSSLSVPTVAVIHGSCLGAGLELALACRRRVALASTAPIQVGVPEVHFGLIPAWGAITQLPRLIGPDDGLDLLITGRTIGYLLARSHGLVDRLASQDDSIESLDVLGTDPAPERTWPKEVWDAAWNLRGKRSTNNREISPRPSFKSSRSFRSTSLTAARLPAKRPSKPWERSPCRKTFALPWPTFSIAD